MMLYLLPFKSGTEFKFGITTSDRIKRIDRIYSVDLMLAKIVTAKSERTIRYLENEIKTVFVDFISNKHAGKDGSSEILPIELWDAVIKMIETKMAHEWLEVKVENYIASETTTIKMENTISAVVRNPFVRNTISKTISIKKSYSDVKHSSYSKYNESLDFQYEFLLKHRYGKELIEAARLRSDEIIFSEKNYPGILDFGERIKHLCLQCEVCVTTSSGRMSEIKRIDRTVPYVHSVDEFIDEDSLRKVCFKLTQEFIKDVSCGRVENLLALSHTCTLEEFLSDVNFIPLPVEKVRDNYYYLSNGIEHFETLLSSKYSESSRKKFESRNQDWGNLDDIF